jgi:hypothetical protein
MSDPILELDPQSPFFWRNATINKDVSYVLHSDISPYNKFNGRIDSWSNSYMMSSSYPSHCGPVFTPHQLTNEERSKYYNNNQVDNYGFYWKCTENQAKDFLAKNYPNIHKKYLEDYNTV